MNVCSQAQCELEENPSVVRKKWRCVPLFQSYLSSIAILHTKEAFIDSYLNQSRLPSAIDLPLLLKYRYSSRSLRCFQIPTFTDLFDSCCKEKGCHGVCIKKSTLCASGVFEACLPSWGGWFVPLYLYSQNLPEACLSRLQTQAKADERVTHCV